jgi:hypothetical protein
MPNFARIPADVIGFVSQFFSSTSSALSSTSTLGRPSSCADDGRDGAQRQPPRAKAHGGIHLAVCCMTTRILRAKEPWLTGAMGEEQQPVPGVESLASPRNSINMAAKRALRYAGVCSFAAWERAEGELSGVVPSIAGGLRDHGQRGGTQNTFLRGCGRMATTVERRRPSLSNKPALGGRSGYEAADARISITARGHPRLTTPGRIHSRQRRKGQPTSSLQNGSAPYIPLVWWVDASRNPQSAASTRIWTCAARIRRHVSRLPYPSDDQKPGPTRPR